jgi:hypothetical protein
MMYGEGQQVNLVHCRRNATSAASGADFKPNREPAVGIAYL